MITKVLKYKIQSLMGRPTCRRLNVGADVKLFTEDY